MSNSFALNTETWDLELDPDTNSLRRVVGVDRTAQAIRERLGFFRGEWFLDRLAGVPYFQHIFVKPFNPALTESLLKTEILGTRDVTGLLNFALVYNRANRISDVQFCATTTEGAVRESVCVGEIANA